MAARQAVVSGGGSGIGKAISHRLVEDGDKVVILGRRSEVLAQAADELNAVAGEKLVTWHRVDLTRPDEVVGAAEAIAAGGPVDVLVNNAGGRVHGGLGGDLHEVAAFWQRNFEANVLPTVLLTQAMLRHMRRPGGRIIAVGSVAAFLGRGAYGAAKAALHAWAYGLAPTLAADGVTVNVVAPGMVPDLESPMYQRHAAKAAEVVERDIPMARFGTQSEVAAMVGYLASPEAGYVTGQILQVNGGMVLGRG